MGQDYPLHQGEAILVLGILRESSNKHRGNLWWNGEVEDKVEDKKVAYLRFAESKNKEEKQKNREKYKISKKEAKLLIMAAKNAAFESLYALL